ncbi:hypothetical protein, partial [Victivallis vadensis]|uniref:hypothetical protein n=1 Tax=Victivallis vadensis TaxID=172901 RepID=UPI00266C6AAE
VADVRLFVHSRGECTPGSLSVFADPRGAGILALAREKPLLPGCVVLSGGISCFLSCDNLLNGERYRSFSKGIG